MIEKYEVRQGGLMRCCLASLEELMAAATVPPKEGDRVTCRGCNDVDGMVFRNGSWEWGASR